MASKWNWDWNPKEDRIPTATKRRAPHRIHIVSSRPEIEDVQLIWDDEEEWTTTTIRRRRETVTRQHGTAWARFLKWFGAWVVKILPPTVGGALTAWLNAKLRGQ